MAIGLTTLLKTVVDNKASGLHIRGNSNAYVRINTKIREIEDCFLTNDDVKKIASAIMGEREKKMFDQNLSVDFALDAKEYGRFRFNVFRQSGKICMAIRHIPLRIPSFEQLSLPGETLKKIADNHRGIILVTGMTGSGKSSTLAAMVDYINKTRSGHILTVEDPIEFVHTSKKSIVHQRELGQDTRSMANALRSALREDPDVILVGEMRDLETIGLALTAAETGHLVMGTLHTSSAAQTIDRIVDVFPEGQQQQIRLQLSNSLVAVFSQTLLQKLSEDGVTKKGRVMAQEIMLVMGAIANLIREQKTAQIYSSLQTGTSLGMQTLDMALRDLVLAKKVDPQDALAKSTHPDELKRMLGMQVESQKLY